MSTVHCFLERLDRKMPKDSDKINFLKCLDALSHNNLKTPSIPTRRDLAVCWAVECYGLPLISSVDHNLIHTFTSISCRHCYIWRCCGFWVSHLCHIGERAGLKVSMLSKFLWLQVGSICIIVSVSTYIRIETCVDAGVEIKRQK